MTLEKYLELIFSVYENFYDQLDSYYKEANFITDVTGNTPIKFVVDKGELKILIHKCLYSNYEKNKHVYMALGFYKSSLSNNYMTEESVVYPMHQEALKNAIDYVSQHKELFKSLQERKSFYSENNRVTIEALEFSKDKENATLTVSVSYGDYKTTHLFANLKERYLETVDDFPRSFLSEIIIPERYIPDVIKELSLSNNFPITPLTEEEKIIHVWHPWPPKVESPKERSMRRWLTF